MDEVDIQDRHIWLYTLQSMQMARLGVKQYQLIRCWQYL